MQCKENDMKFEEALKRLEEIAVKMEHDSLSLEESIKMFEEGMELALFCSKKLDEAERKISIVLKGKDGQMSEEDFYPRED